MASCIICWQNGSMKPAAVSIQVRHVPADVHAVLRERAASEGKSLQEYVLGLLVAQARRPTRHEVLARAGRRAEAQREYTVAAGLATDPATREFLLRMVLAVAVGEHDPDAVRGEAAHDRGADSSGATGDQGGAARQRHDAGRYGPTGSRYCINANSFVGVRPAMRRTSWVKCG
jgi:plasmid stability protein